MIDTLRLLVTWACNLKCSYCCNEIPEVRATIDEVPVDLLDIDFSKYRNVCVTGGEPLLAFERTKEVIDAAARAGCFVILYTNGVLMTPARMRTLQLAGLGAVNLGLHDERTFDTLVSRALESVPPTVSLRFHVEDRKAAWFPLHRPDIPAWMVHPWEMNVCARGNEERRVLA